MAVELRAVRRLRRAPYVADENQRIFFAEFQADFQKGVGVNSGPPEDVNPEAALSWSDDRGHTWRTPIRRPLGKLGAYRTRVIWRRLGKSRMRIFELATEARVRIVITDAYLELSMGRH